MVRRQRPHSKSGPGIKYQNDDKAAQVLNALLGSAVKKYCSALQMQPVCGQRAHRPLEEPEIEGICGVGTRIQGMHRKEVCADEVVAVGTAVCGCIVTPGECVARQIPA